MLIAIILISQIFMLMLGLAIGSKRNQKELDRLIEANGYSKIALRLYKQSQKDIERVQEGIIKC